MKKVLFVISILLSSNLGYSQTTNLRARNINNLRFCTQFIGGNNGIRIANCIANLPSTGGVLYDIAEGIQTWSSNPFSGITKPVELHIGCSTITSSVPIIPSNGSRIVGDCGGRRTNIIGAHTGEAVVSLRGRNDVILENITITGSQVTPPQTGILMGRSTDTPTTPSSLNNSTNFKVEGYFTKAAFYTIGAEDNIIINADIELNGGGALYAFATANYDFLSVGGIQQNTNTDNNYINMRVLNRYRVTGGSAIYVKLNQTEYTKFDTCYIQSTNNAYITLDMDEVSTYGESRGPLTFTNCGSEPSSVNSPAIEPILYGARFTRSASGTTEIIIRNIRFIDTFFEAVQNTPTMADGRRIYCPASTNLTIDGFSFESIWRSSFANVIRGMDFNNITHFILTSLEDPINVAEDMTNGELSIDAAVTIAGARRNLIRKSVDDGTGRFYRFDGTDLQVTAAPGQTGIIREIQDSSAANVETVTIGTPYTHLWNGKMGIGTALPATERFGVTGALSNNASGVELTNTEGPQVWRVISGRPGASNTILTFRDQTGTTDVMQLTTGGILSILKAGGQLTLPPIHFADLGTPGNGTYINCDDCTIANPCAGGGGGAFAKRQNGTWICN